MVFEGGAKMLLGGAGSSDAKTLATSCIVGLSEGFPFVQRRASWKVFFTWVRSMQVIDTSGSTVSIIVLLSALDNICKPCSTQHYSQLQHFISQIMYEFFCIHKCVWFSFGWQQSLVEVEEVVIVLLQTLFCLIKDRTIRRKKMQKTLTKWCRLESLSTAFFPVNSSSRTIPKLYTSDFSFNLELLAYSGSI